VTPRYDDNQHNHKDYVVDDRWKSHSSLFSLKAKVLSVTVHNNCYYEPLPVSALLHTACQEGSNGISNALKKLCGLSPQANCTDRAIVRLSAKLVPTFDTAYRVVSAADPYGRNLGFPDQSRYFFFQVSPSIVLTRLEWTPFQTRYF
jgi:hypothetical protein